MKKNICWFLVLVFSFIYAVASAESFELHSGVQFGMTMEEVRRSEENAGFSVSGENDTMNVDVEFLGGMPGGYVVFYFSSAGCLNKCEYQFGSSEASYSSIYKLYSTKYGTPIATSSSSMREITGEAGNTMGTLDGYKYFVENYTFNFGVGAQSASRLNGVCQWLVPLDNGGVVEIVFVSFDRIGTYAGSSNCVTYFFRTPEESKELIDLLNQKKNSFGDI